MAEDRPIPDTDRDRHRGTHRSGDPDDFGSPYRLLSGAVTPRPIAWVSSRGPAGENLAPYSFFNVVAVSPPVVMFAPVATSDDPKDSLRNALETEAFAVNLVDEAVVEAMNASSATLPSEETEFDVADVTPVDGDVVDAPRVAEAPVAFECELAEAVEVGSSMMVLGEVVRADVDEALLADGKFDVTDYDAVGRMAGNRYATTRQRFELVRPP